MKNQLLPAMEFVCGNDSLRPVMQHVLLTKEYFVATNAHMMVWHSTEKFFDPEFIQAIPDKGFLIHKKDWKLLVGAQFLGFEGELIKIFYSGFIRPEVNGKDQKYPNWQAVVPEANNTELSATCINPTYLLNIQKAIGYGKANLALHFTGKTRAILIRSTEEEFNSYHDCAGLIMPVMYSYDMVGAEKELLEAMDIVNH
jgi:hypothetical protein